jgi:LCP family protein required for cell wall assembly
LRDSWVEIPSKGKKAKLNAAYAYGGAQLTIDTIEYNFLIDIDHYVLVDFDMFTQIIDAVGGVEVEVTEKEAKFIRNTTRFKEMESGENVRLSGAEALVYCRIRKLDSDYMRTFRQRKVISALMEQANETEISALIDAINEVLPLIQTDLSKSELLSIGLKGGYGLLAYEVQQTRAPIEEHMRADTINGQWVEVLELDNVREYLYDFIYTDKINPEDNEEE